jgi:glycosyltransferase involved in cell wall biosynthesis
LFKGLTQSRQVAKSQSFLRKHGVFMLLRLCVKLFYFCGGVIGVIMKIGLLIYGSIDTLSGGYLYDRQLVEYLRARGESVEIISLPWRNYAAHLSDNLSFRLPDGLDVLIQDELNHPSLLAANAQKHLYPIISLVHHLRSSEEHPAWLRWFYRIVEQRYLRSVDGFIFNSQTTERVVRGLAGERAPGLVAYPPTDRFGEALPVEFVAARAMEPGPLRLVLLGNLIPRKGLHTLLEALGSLPPDFSLDVIGSQTADPGYAARMQQRTRELGLAERVTFHGALENLALVEKLRTAQVLVVPSSYEGFGIVYLEGMAFGLPAIGSTAGAAAEIITQGETGYLVRPGDAVDLAQRLVALAHERKLLQRMSLQALERYQSQPTWLQTAESIHKFLGTFVKRE